jgi:hypothetical protein
MVALCAYVDIYIYIYIYIYIHIRGEQFKKFKKFVDNGGAREEPARAMAPLKISGNFFHVL